MFSRLGVALICSGRGRARRAGRRSARRGHDGRRPRGRGRGHRTRRRRSERSTRTRARVTAPDAKAAAAAVAGRASGRGPVGAGRRLAGGRRARRAAAERQGPRVRLDRRQRDRDLPGAGPHAGDGVGSGDGHARRRSTSTPASTSSAAAWRISSTAGCSSPAGTRTSSSTASSRRTSSIPRRTRGASARTWRPGAGIRRVTPLRNGEMLITSGRVDTPEVRTLDGSAALAQHRVARACRCTRGWTSPRTAGLLLRPRPDAAQRSTRPGTGAWQTLGQRDTINRDYGGHALYDVGKMLVAGGGPSTKDARVVDFNGATPQVSTTAPMAYGRRQHNLTVLADGTVLATGGNSSGASLVDLNAGVYPAEQWNPATGQWRTLAAMQITRQYHSTALLLPDGRVLSSGGGICGTCDQVGYLAKNAEIFSPPYLFQADGTLAPRPAIDAAPAPTSYGAPIRRSRPRTRRRSARSPSSGSARSPTRTTWSSATSRSPSPPARRASPPPRRPTPTSRRPASTCSSSSTPTACRRSPRWSASRATRRRPSRSRSRRTARPSPRPRP